MEIPALIVGLALLLAGVFIGHYFTVMQLAGRHVAQLREAHMRGMRTASMVSNCAYEMVRSAVTEHQFIQVMNEISIKKYGIPLPLGTSEAPKDGDRIQPPISPGEGRTP